MDSPPVQDVPLGVQSIWPSRPIAYWLVFALALALALDFIFFTGYYGSDDFGYYMAARRLAGEGELQLNLAAGRLAVNLPNALVYRLSGGSLTAIASFHCVYHLVLVVLAFQLGRVVRGEVCGAIAAVLVGADPILYLYAGAILPDLATAVWLAAALLLLETMRRRHRSGAAPGTATCIRYYGAAGFAIGLAYSCKIAGLVMVVPAAICVIAATPTLRSWQWIRNGAFVAGGLLLFIVLEAVLLRVYVGEWASRFNLLSGYEEQFLEYMQRQGTWPWQRLAYALRRFGSVHHIGVYGYIAIALGYPFVRRRNISLLAFFWWPFLYLTMGTTSLSSYQPPMIQGRYYAIVIVPMALMAAAVALELRSLWHAWQTRPRWLHRATMTTLSVTAAIYLLGFALHSNLRRSGNIYRSAQMRAAVAAAKKAQRTHPGVPIVFTEDLGARAAPMFLPKPPAAVHLSTTLWPRREPPAAPYLLVLDIASYDPTDFAEAWQRQSSLCAHVLYDVYRWEDRALRVSRWLSNWFDDLPADKHSTSLKGVMVLLVESMPLEGGRSCQPMPPPALLRLSSENVGLRTDSTGYDLEWGGNDAFWLHFFDREMTRPSAKAAQVPSTSRLVVAIPLENTSAAALEVEAWGMGFGPSEVAKASAKLTLEPRARETARLELATPEMTATRFGLRVRPTSSGTLRVGVPHIASGGDD